MTVARRLVEVPASAEMDDETFIAHFNKRHLADVGLRAVIRYSPLVTYIPSFRAFHERCHRLARPGQYNHEHDDYD